MRIMTWVKAGSCVAVFVVLTTCMYFTYFHHAPAEDILAANKRSHQQRSLSRRSDGSEDEYYDDDYDYDGDEAAQSRKEWDRFIDDNDFVSIGEIFDKCEGDDRIMIGRVILMPDKKLGGVKARIFANMTFENGLTGGNLHLTCWYKNRELYSNYWDLCTMEEDEPDRLIYCPIKRSHKYYVKDKKIPSYLPKGHFKSKAWITDENDKEVACGAAEFDL